MAVCSLGRLNHAAGSVKVLKVTDEAIRISRVLKWLLTRQNGDGSWGQGDVLDKIVTTKNVLLTLLSAGLPANHLCILNGFKWLTINHNHHHLYQRSFALAKIPGFEPIVNRDLEELEKLCVQGGGPHRDQLLHADALYLYRVLGLENPKILEHVRSLIKEWSSTECWRNRSTTTAFALAILLDYDFDKKEDIVEVSKNFLKQQACEPSNDMVHWEGLVVATAYVVCSISESGLANDERLIDLARKGVNWVLSKANTAGYWGPEELVHGGGGTIKSPEYFTSIAMRSVIAYWSSFDPYFATEITLALYYETEHKLKIWRTIALCFCVPLLIGIFVLSLIYLSGLLRVIGIIGSVLATAAGLVTFYNPEWYQRWLRRRKK